MEHTDSPKHLCLCDDCYERRVHERRVQLWVAYASAVKHENDVYWATDHKPQRNEPAPGRPTD